MRVEPFRVLIKMTLESSLAPSATKEPSVNQKAAITRQFASALILDFPASSTVRNKFSVVYKPFSLWYFVIAVQTD